MSFCHGFAIKPSTVFFRISPSHLPSPFTPNTVQAFPLFLFERVKKNVQTNMLKADIFHFELQFVCLLTVLARLNVQDVAADSVSGLCVGQHLDAVVGELLQPSQLHLFTCGGDILHLSPFWRRRRRQEGETLFKQFST